MIGLGATMASWRGNLSAARCIPLCIGLSLHGKRMYGARQFVRKNCIHGLVALNATFRFKDI